MIPYRVFVLLSAGDRGGEFVQKFLAPTVGSKILHCAVGKSRGFLHDLVACAPAAEREGKRAAQCIGESRGDGAFVLQPQGKIVRVVEKTHFEQRCGNARLFCCGDDYKIFLLHPTVGKA